MATLTITQEWFLKDGSAITKNEEKVWSFPLLYISEGVSLDDGWGQGTEDGREFLIRMAGQDEVNQALITAARTKLEVKCGSSKCWIKLNASQKVPLRVKMEETLAFLS